MPQLWLHNNAKCQNQKVNCRLLALGGGKKASADGPGFGGHREMKSVICCGGGRGTEVMDSCFLLFEFLTIRENGVF